MTPDFTFSPTTILLSILDRGAMWQVARFASTALH